METDARANTFEDIFSAAVDRQAAEQKSLREALDGIRASITDMRGAVDSLRNAVDRNAQAGVGPLSGTVDLMGEIRTSTVDTAADVRGVADALVDMNAGLREWCERVEGQIGALARSTLGALRDLAGAQKQALDDIDERLGSIGTNVGQLSAGGVLEEVRNAVKSATGSLAERLDGVEERIVEAGDLSRYLQDQMQDLDSVLARLSEVPKKLDGVVAQAVKRSATLRAGLAGEAEKAFDRVLRPMGGNIGRLLEALEAGTDVPRSDLAAEVHRMSLRQAELVGRVDALVASIQERQELAEPEFAPEPEPPAAPPKSRAKRTRKPKKPEPDNAPETAPAPAKRKKPGAKKRAAGTRKTARSKAEPANRKGAKGATGGKTPRPRRESDFIPV